MPITITRRSDKTKTPQKVFSVPKEDQPIPNFKENPGPGNWVKEACVCTECGWTGTARLNRYWTLDKFVCKECRGPLEIDKDD